MCVRYVSSSLQLFRRVILGLTMVVTIRNLQGQTEFGRSMILQRNYSVRYSFCIWASCTIRLYLSRCRELSGVYITYSVTTLNVLHRPKNFTTKFFLLSKVDSIMSISDSNLPKCTTNIFTTDAVFFLHNHGPTKF